MNLPTELHRKAIEMICDFFAKENCADTILLTNSCARGKAIAESDIDFAILLKQTSPPEEIKALENKWVHFLQREPTLLKYRGSHRFAQIHLDFISGIYEASNWDDGCGPDFFEVEIGNHLIYSAPLTGEGEYFTSLRKKWLPYYSDAMQLQRLKMVKKSCSYDLDQISFLVKRELYFYAFDKLYKAFQEFLQALFISRKIYPIAYNKWIKEQFYEILSLPELYEKLPPIISVRDIESHELNDKSDILRSLLEAYC
ncbi:MAG: nucleotidyltransferase domain-containing protein [Ginsengibacter sp.]